MSHAEFIEWRAFAEIEPLPQLRSDITNAMQMLLLYTINKGKKGKNLKLDDFMPDWWNSKRSPQALARKFRALTANVEKATQDDSNEEESLANVKHFR